MTATETLENAITEAVQNQGSQAGNTKIPETIQTTPTENKQPSENTSTTPKNEDSKENTNTTDTMEQRMQKLQEAEARIDAKLAKLNEVDIGGRSTVEQTLSKEQKIDQECNDFLKGTGLKI